MEYYFYVILIFAIVLKLTVYLCWYQVRRSSATREVRIIMPDGTTQCAVISARGRVQRSQQSRSTSEDRQNLPQADALSPYDNQGMVESAVQPRYTDSPHCQFTGPPPYASQEWKLPKYEEVVGMPPPYTTEEPELASAVQPGDTVPPSSNQIQVIPSIANPVQASIPAPTYPGQQVSHDVPPYSPPMTSVMPRVQPMVSPTSNSSRFCNVSATFPNSESRS